MNSVSLETGELSPTGEGGRGGISPTPVSAGGITPTPPPSTSSRRPTPSLLYSEAVKDPQINQEKRIQDLELKIQTLSEQYESLRSQLVYDVGSARNPTTLKSDKLTPELIAIGSSLHIWDYGILNEAIDPKRWDHPFGYHSEIGHSFLASANVIIDKVQQLPMQTKSNGVIFPVNIIFPTTNSRAAGVHSLKNYCYQSNITNLPLHYSLTNNPILKHQVKAVSIILKDLKKEGAIKYYCLNNFMAVNSNQEKLAPIFSFQTHAMDTPSNYSDCPSNEFFFNGKIIPTSDKKFESEEFLLLKEIIRSSLKYDLEQEAEYNIYNLPKDSSLLDIVKDKPRGKPKSKVNPNRKQSTPYKPLQVKTHGKGLRRPSSTSLKEFLNRELKLGWELDHVASMPDKPNLSIPSTTSSETSRNTSPIDQPIQQQIEVHE